MSELTFYCDGQRHLVCTPFSVENLHRMARELEINRCWYHASSKFPHYDIPKRRVAEIMAKCKKVSPAEILSIIKAAHG